MADPTIQDLIAQLKNAGSNPATQPLGVPQGYLGAPTPDPYAPLFGVTTLPLATVEPKYFPGDQVTQASKLSPEDRTLLQQRLRQIGLIDPKAKIAYGVWDTTSASAFEQVLAWANATGTDWQGALYAMEADAAANPTAPTQTTKATNPADIHALGTSAAQAGLGYGLTLDQHQKFQQDFQNAESPYLGSDSAVDSPGAAGWQDWAQQEVRNIDPTRFDARKVVSGFDVLDRMIKGQI